MASKEPQDKKYILRKPYELPNGDKWIDVSWEDFDELFVEFDEDTTRKQIADIITFYRTLVNGWAETGAGADDLPETALEESIDAILDVTLGRKQ